MGKKPAPTLTFFEMYDAYHAALKQANSLLSEARLLIDNGLDGGAVHRLVISLEEIGKARLVFFQGALATDGRAVDWKSFWQDFRSHTVKLDHALAWNPEFLSLMGDSATQVERAIATNRARASALDKRKQQSSYSGAVDGSFDVPEHEEFQGEARALLSVVESTISWTRSNPVTAASRDEFQSALARARAYANALGYMGCKSKEEAYEAIAQGGRGLFSVTETAPTDEDFIARVSERYEIMPGRLGVTLPQLRSEQSFLEFYQSLRDESGYPDWVILSVLYNIALNARVDVGRLRSEDVLSTLGDWSEKIGVDEPLDVRLFTDLERFEAGLDLWLVAFLAGLGVVAEMPEGNTHGVRRAAAAAFGIFNRDVPHEPLFPARPA